MHCRWALAPAFQWARCAGLPRWPQLHQPGPGSCTFPFSLQTDLPCYRKLGHGCCGKETPLRRWASEYKQNLVNLRLPSWQQGIRNISAWELKKQWGRLCTDSESISDSLDKTWFYCKENRPHSHIICPLILSAPKQWKQKIQKNLQWMCLILGITFLSWFWQVLSSDPVSFFAPHWWSTNLQTKRFVDFLAAAQAHSVGSWPSQVCLQWLYVCVAALQPVMHLRGGEIW